MLTTARKEYRARNLLRQAVKLEEEARQLLGNDWGEYIQAKWRAEDEFRLQQMERSG